MDAIGFWHLRGQEPAVEAFRIAGRGARTFGGSMDREKWDEQIKWGLTAFAVISAAVGVAFLVFNLNIIRGGLGRILNILTPVIYGAVMAYLMAPVYDLTERKLRERMERYFPGKRFPHSFARFFATFSALLLLLLVSGSLVYIMIPELMKSLTRLSSTLPDSITLYYEKISGLLKSYPEAREALSALYEEAYGYFSGPGSSSGSGGGTLIPNLQMAALYLSKLSSGIWSTLTWVKNILIGLIVMAYLLNLKELLIAQFHKLLFALLPRDAARSVVEELDYINRMFGGFIIGKILDSIIIGILTFFVLSIMRMPYAMLVSVIVGITNVIPFFGPFIGAIPCFVLIFLANPLQGLYFAIAILVIQQLDGNVIGPRILGNSTGLSSFWVLFSILLFGGLFGFVGMIIAVPTWAVILNLIARISNRRLREKGLPLSSEAYREGELPDKRARGDPGKEEKESARGEEKK